MWGKRGESEERWQKRKTRAGGESPNKREELREEKKKKKSGLQKASCPSAGCSELCDGAASGKIPWVTLGGK